MMRGASAEGFDTTQKRVEKLSDKGDAAQLGTELFQVAGVLSKQAQLRRALTDPSAAPKAKSGLAKHLFSGKLSSDTVDVVATAAASRWSSGADFVDAIEQLGALALVISAEKDGDLGDLEDQLFRLGRIVVGDALLRDAITNRQLGVERRQALVSGLLEGKVSNSAIRLAVQAVATRHRSFELALEEFQNLAADRQRRLVAVVRSAIELTDDERQRLEAGLARQYGRKIHLNTVVDPDVLAGVRVELGDDVIDATVVRRLDDARRRMTG
jgi:F-type H+-transporting ATPase subunit delta